MSVQQEKTTELRCRIASSAAIFVLAGWLVWAWTQNIERIIRYYTPVPYWDYWRTAMLLRFYQTLNYGILWFQHNEHRIVFQELVYAADYLLMHGRQFLPIAVSFACYFASWIALGWALASDARVPGRVRAAGILLAGVVLAWEGSAVIIVNPFLLQWTLPTVAIIFSLASLVRLKESGRNGYLLAVILAAIVATYSSANGMLIWPIVVAGGLILSVERRQILIVACAGAVSVGIYFIGYQFTGTLSITNLIRHPLYLMKFIGSYMAMPFSAVASYGFGALLGLVAMALVAGLAAAAGRAGLIRSRPGIVLFGSYLYIVISSLLIAAGRMDPTQVGVGNAKSSRYVIQPLIAWAVLILLSVWLCAHLLHKTAAYAAVAVFAVLAPVGFSTLTGWLRERDAEFVELQLGALAVRNDVFERRVVMHLFPWKPENVEIWSQGLRDGHLSVFYKGYRGWLGHPVSSFGHLGAPIAGEITYSSAVTGGVEIAGWADWSAVRRTSGWLLLADETGRIVGIGRKLPAGFPEALRNLKTPESLGWVAFVNSKYSATSLRAYVITKEGLAPVGSGLAPIYHTNG